MGKIVMTTPIVEMDGDEMTRILWQMIKDELLTPFVELKTETGKLTALQEVQIGRLKALGQNVRVLHGIREVEEFLRWCEDYGI